MNRRASTTAVVLTCALLTACGRGPEPAPGRSAVTAAAKDKPAKGSASAGAAQQAEKAAKAVVLRTGDVPGWTLKEGAGDSESTPAEELSLDRMTACIGSPPVSAEVGDAEAVGTSPDESVAVMAYATVWASRKAAVQEVTSTSSPRLQRCMTKYLGEVMALKSGGVLFVNDVTVKPLSVPQTRGVEQQASRRLTASLSVGEKKLPLTFDIVVVRRKQTTAGVMLMTSGTAPKEIDLHRAVRAASSRLARAAI